MTQSTPTARKKPAAKSEPASKNRRAAKSEPAVDPMLPQSFYVRQVRRETADTRTLELGTVGGESVPFAPGQFNMVYAFGQGEVPISISGDPARPERLLHTVRAVGKATTALANLKKGAAVGIRGPFGSHWPVEEAEGKDVMVVAGGIGLAPLRPALYSLLADRHRYGRVILLYGTRRPEELLFRAEVQRLRGRFDLEVEVTVDAADRSWGGHVGVVTTLIPRIHFDADQTVAMVCGPEVMMQFTVRDLLTQGLSAERVYVSMERNMKCAIGFCGHCQIGPDFVCKDGPVFRYDHIEPHVGVREL